MTCPKCNKPLEQTAAVVFCPVCGRKWHVSPDSGGMALIEDGYFENLAKRSAKKRIAKH